MQPSTKRTPELVAEIAAFIAQGHSATQAGKRFGISRGTVRIWTDPEYERRCKEKQNTLARKRWRNGGKEDHYHRYHNDPNYWMQRKEQTRRSRARRRWKLILWSSNRDAIKRGHTPCLASPEELEAMFVAQQAACKMCNKPEADKKLHMDHDHKTGALRGFLCDGCNRGLGHLGDDPLMAAIRLAKYSGQLNLIIERLQNATSL